MATKLGPLCRVKFLNNGRDKLVLPEKAGVGGSTPSLATIILKDLAKNYVLSCSPLAVRILRGRRNRSVYSNDFEQLSANVFSLSPLSVRFGLTRPLLEYIVSFCGFSDSLDKALLRFIGSPDQKERANRGC